MPKKKKPSLLSKLKLNTFKGRMLATVLAFALVGGGVMVYKSFAASVIVTWPITDWKCTLSAGMGYCVKGTDVDPGAKAGNTTFGLAYNGQIENFTANTDVQAPASLQRCASVKGRGSLSFANKTAVPFNSPDAYSTVCSQPYQITGTGKWVEPPSFVRLFEGNFTKDSVTAKINNVWLQYADTSAPGPAPSF